MTTTSDENEDDFQFAAVVAAGISKARDDFFAFMKTFDEDLADPGVGDDADWQCLKTYFSKWVHTRARQGAATGEFEEFDRVLPQILLAVIDEALRYPELLDASPTNRDGTLRRRSRRSIPFIFQTKTDRDDVLRRSPDWDAHGDEVLMYSLLLEPFPPVQKFNTN